MLSCVSSRGVLFRVWELIDSTPFDEPGYQDGYQLVLSCLFEMNRDGSPGRTTASIQQSLSHLSGVL